jgi:hypothetical protein
MVKSIFFMIFLRNLVGAATNRLVLLTSSRPETRRFRCTQFVSDPATGRDLTIIEAHNSPFARMRLDHVVHRIVSHTFIWP